MTRTHTAFTALAAAAALGCAGTASAAATLSGWAQLPANTFSDGPTSGQFAGAGAGGNALPLVNRQPVQGFSAVLQGPSAGSYLVMPDNGFGAQANSADTLLRMYAVRPDFKTATGGTGTVSAASWATGAAQASFDAGSRITLSDPDNRLTGFPIQASYTRYYNAVTNPLVDASIRSGRLLTGADFDIELVRKDKNGNLWFGDEFGPFLLKTDATGKLLKGEFSLPGVFAPANPYRGATPANLGTSNGFEGMAINKAGDRLYTLLEGSVAGDAAKTLRINEFNIDTEQYTGAQWKYKLENAGTNLGDMTAISDHVFLVIERNGGTATTALAPFKKVYRIDTSQVDAEGNVLKTEVVDLMNIADPDDLNGDGLTTFTFPYVTIESVLILDAKTLLIINDNNYPGVGGRSASASDNTEFLRLSLSNAVPEPGTAVLAVAALAAAGVVRRRRTRG